MQSKQYGSDWGEEYDRVFGLISKFGKPHESMINNSLPEIYMAAAGTLPDLFRLIRPVEVFNAGFQLAIYGDRVKQHGVMLNGLSDNWKKISYCETLAGLTDLIDNTIKKDVWFDATAGFFKNTSKMILGFSVCENISVVQLEGGDFNANLVGKHYFDIIDSNNFSEHIKDSEFDENIKNTLNDLAIFLTS